MQENLHYSNCRNFSYHNYAACNFYLPHVAESVSVSSDDEAGGTKQAASENVERASKHIVMTGVYFR